MTLARVRAVVGVLAALTACSHDPVVPAPPLPPAESPRALPEPESVVVDGASLATAPVEIEPALHRDEFVSGGEVRVRRIIYQVNPVVTWALGYGNTELLAPTGEIVLDISGSRLRARFQGTGLAADDGSEIRLRADEHGTYVFDGRGGRSVGTGQLAAWYQDGPGARGVEFKLRQAVPDDAHTIELVCRFFGEWAGASIASVRRACGSLGLPTKFRFGPYRIDRTAETVVYLPETALRSDEREPPRGLRHESVVQFFEPRALARLAPTIDDVPERRLRPGEVRPTVDEGMTVENRTGARVLVTIDGVALGWLDPSETTHFSGMPPGGYWVGAMFPLGGIASRRRAHRLPAYVVLER